MRTRIIIMWLSAALLTLFFSGCTRNGGADIGTRPTVTVSIPPQAFLLQKIAGNSLNINTMLPPGADAESYEPSMQAQRSLEESGEYAMVGTLPLKRAWRRSSKTYIRSSWSAARSYALIRIIITTRAKSIITTMRATTRTSGQRRDNCR